MSRVIVIATALSLLAGCATQPRGAGYVPLVDMLGHEEAQFSQDLHQCQAYAAQRMNAAEGAAAGAVLGALLGALAAPRGYRNYVAGHVAVAGAVAGAAGANETQETITKRCLAGRGYNVLN
jgi:outer membrane lipoprotein SlyB